MLLLFGARLHLHGFGLEPIGLRREVDAKIAGQHKDLLKLRSGLQRLASRSERLAVDDQRRYFGVGQDIEVIGFRPFRVKGGVPHAERLSGPVGEYDFGPVGGEHGDAVAASQAFGRKQLGHLADPLFHLAIGVSPPFADQRRGVRSPAQRAELQFGDGQTQGKTCWSPACADPATIRCRGELFLDHRANFLPTNRFR